MSLAQWRDKTIHQPPRNHQQSPEIHQHKMEPSRLRFPRWLVLRLIRCARIRYSGSRVGYEDGQARDSLTFADSGIDSSRLCSLSPRTGDLPRHDFACVTFGPGGLFRH